MKNSWDTYWRTRDKAPVERMIERYKMQTGYRRIIDSLPEIGIAGRVLEIGAGKARISRILKDRGWQTVALDSNPAVAGDNFRSVDAYVIGDIFTLPFDDHSFDLVMCCGLLEHFSEDDVCSILAEMARVGRSVAAWLPTCGIEWKILWTLRNLIGGNVYDHVFRHEREKLEELLLLVGPMHVRSGVITFGGFFRYFYLYGSFQEPHWKIKR